MQQCNELQRLVKYGGKIHHPPSHHRPHLINHRCHLINHHRHNQAAATVSCEDRPNIAAEYMGRAGRLYVRIKKYDEAVSHDDGLYFNIVILIIIFNILIIARLKL